MAWKTKKQQRDYNKAYWKKNKKKRSKQNKIWKIKNKKKLAKYMRKYGTWYYRKMKKKILKRSKRNYRKNKKRINKKHIKYNKSHRRQRRIWESKRQRSAVGRYNRAKYVSKTRGISFTLSFDTFTQISSLPCYYCGTPRKEVVGLHLDRLNNDKGYCNGNVVPCCKICNIMKNNLTFRKFKNHVCRIFKNLKLI